ncbi:ECF transporter S component [Candidatus Neomarinimicrobiota bacterium]
MDLNKLVRASIFTALAIGLGFSLLMVPNVELITVIVFLAGLTLGVSWGALVGGTAELIFSVLNPFGSGLVFPPLLMSQVFSMIIIGAAGGLMCPVFFKRKFSTKRIASLAITGFVLTFIFDSLTTLSYPLSAGFDWPQTIGIYISGIGFTILHQLSNTIVFAVGVPSVVKHLA